MTACEACGSRGVLNGSRRVTKGASMQRETKPGAGRVALARDVDRRAFLWMAAGATGAGLLPRFAWGQQQAGAAAVGDAATAVRFPEKVRLITLTDYPPNLETPLKYFREDLTPNEAFYVRWHLGITPTRVDLATYRLKLGGHVER